MNSVKLYENAGLGGTFSKSFNLAFILGFLGKLDLIHPNYKWALGINTNTSYKGLPKPPRERNSCSLRSNNLRVNGLQQNWFKASKMVFIAVGNRWPGHGGNRPRFSSNGISWVTLPAPVGTMTGRPVGSSCGLSGTSPKFL